MSMSRVGKKPILLPSGVSLRVEENTVYVQGPKGKSSLILPINSGIKVNINNNRVYIKIREDSNSNYLKSQHGLFRTLINNMVIGVSDMFTIELNLKGVGYRCQAFSDELILSLGFSHTVTLKIPEEIMVEVDSNVNIKITGIDKEKVGFFASQIRNYRPPEPYNGKGVLYKGETIIRKAGKSGKK